MIVVHVVVTVSIGNAYSEYFVHGCMVLPVFQHAYLNCPMLYVNICYIQYGHYAKAQRFSMTISVAMNEKLTRGVTVLVLGNVRGELALSMIDVPCFQHLDCLVMISVLLTHFL